MRTALFATGLADTMFPEAVKATVRLLERLGHDRVFSRGQTCCGEVARQHRLLAGGPASTV
jgi:L-lactate dehydrogenase complex protein LldE